MRRLEVRAIVRDAGEGPEYGEPLRVSGDFTITPIPLDAADTSRDAAVKAKWRLRSSADDATTRRLEEFTAQRALQQAEKAGQGTFTLRLIPDGPTLKRCKRLDESLFIFEV